MCQGYVWLSTVHNEDTRKVSGCRYVIHSMWSEYNFFVLHISVHIIYVPVPDKRTPTKHTRMHLYMHAPAFEMRTHDIGCMHGC